MHLVISRRKIHFETSPLSPRERVNPYVFKPKSYSTKRNTTQDMNEKPLRPNPTKKIKRQNPLIKETSLQLNCDVDQLFKQIQKGPQKYFSTQFFPPKTLQIEKEPETSMMKQEENENKKLNPMMKNYISIVSNKNEKIQTIIHQGLLLANTTHAKIGKDEHFLKDVSNPFDFQRRNHYLKSVKFEKDYKSGYAPIQMQQKNSEEPEDTNHTNQNNETSKTHFIRKKQSTLSLPRSCGVSYIKPTQSTQSSPFEPLPPLIFQCSSRCADLKDVREKYQNLSDLFNNVSQTCWIPYIQSTEDDMRDLLLGKRVGQVGWVKGVQHIWPLFTEGSFFLLLYSLQNCLSQEQVWKSFGECPFKIGLLVKKSTSGKKAFLKSLNIKEAKQEQEAKEQKNGSEFKHQKIEIHENNTHEEHKVSSLEEDIAYELKDCRTVITLSLRLQMYVEEQQWKSSSRETKDLLNFIITNFKQTLERNSLEIIRKRLILAKLQHRESMIEEVSKDIRVPVSKTSEMVAERLNKSKIIADLDQLKSLLEFRLANQESYEYELLKTTEIIKYQAVLKSNKTESSWEKALRMPLYYISTRDSFAFDLIEKVTYLQRENGRQYKKIQYFFEPENLPTNYGKQYKQKFPQLNVGVTCYHDFFSNEELDDFEKNTFGTEVSAFKNKFLQMTVQPSIVGNKIKRTKFFFGYRYMWTRCQLAQPGSFIGAGVRKDVTPPPKWTQKVINEFVKSSIAEKDWINSIAINVYHDGKEGLAQHFDDAVRFRQPIYTLRLFSDARLSFGSQFYGFCNGAFIIPLPRGCICVMEQNSYAANGVKHCVRPCDMTGKSAAMILRQMHHKVVSEAKRYDELIDFPAWVSCLSSSPDAITFAEQKRREAEYNISNQGEGITRC